MAPLRLKIFFWEGGGTNAVHSSTPPRLLLWGELVALKRTKFFFYEVKGRWMYQLLTENDCSLDQGWEEVLFLLDAGVGITWA